MQPAPLAEGIFGAENEKARLFDEAFKVRVRLGAKNPSLDLIVRWQGSLHLVDSLRFASPCHSEKFRRFFLRKHHSLECSGSVAGRLG